MIEFCHASVPSHLPNKVPKIGTEHPNRPVLPKVAKLSESLLTGLGKEKLKPAGF
jgi:hypothetical protein